MSERNRGLISLFFNNNEEILEWQELSHRTSFTDPLGSFTLQCAPRVESRATYRENLKKGNLIGFKINGVKQAVSLITTYKESITEAGVTISVDCKSVLATAFEGCVDPYIAKSFNASTPVSSAVLEALSPYGFDKLEADASLHVSALTGKSISGQSPDIIVDSLKHEDVQASPGEKAYTFASKIFTRLGCILHVKVDGTLLLMRPDYTQAPIYTIIEGKTAISGDRVLANPGVEIVDTNEGQYSEVIVVGKDADKRGQTAATAPTTGVSIPEYGRPDSAPFADVKLEELPSGRHSYLSEGGAAYKPLFMFDKRAKDRVRARNMAHTLMGLKASEAYQITCAVDGVISNGGYIWTTGTVCRFVSQTGGIDDTFFILENTKTISVNGGQSTALTLIPLYSLEFGGE